MAKNKPTWKRPTKKAPSRTRAEIQAEYDRAANRAGDLQYKVFAMTQVLTQINTRMFELNQEFQTSAPEVGPTANAAEEQNVPIAPDPQVEAANVEAAECVAPN